MVSNVNALSLTFPQITQNEQFRCFFLFLNHIPSEFHQRSWRHQLPRDRCIKFRNVFRNNIVSEQQVSVRF